jgi:DNA-binding Xre family transcriptional regulator
MSENSSNSRIKIIDMVPLEWTSALLWKPECGRRLRSLRGKTPRREIISFLAARDINFTEESMRRLEDGLTKSITPVMLNALCDSLSIQPAELIPAMKIGVADNFSSII